MFSLLLALQVSTAAPGIPPEVLCAQQRALAISQKDQPADEAAQAISAHCSKLIQAKKHFCQPEVEAICDALAFEAKAKRQAALKRATYQMILRARSDEK
jgi:hypothetical protein